MFGLLPGMGIAVQMHPSTIPKNLLEGPGHYLKTCQATEVCRVEIGGSHAHVPALLSQRGEGQSLAKGTQNWISKLG